MTFKPFHFFAVAVAGWLNREQQDMIAYLREENRILREKLGAKRIILSEFQKCRLAMTATNLVTRLLDLRWSGLKGHCTATETR